MAFKTIEINPIKNIEKDVAQRSQIYKGFSTSDPTSMSTKIYDFELIKQDILNQFNVRQGEMIMNPAYGTIIWGLLYEPFTDSLKQMIATDVNRILNSDPRVIPINIDIIEDEYGFLMDVTLKSVITNQVDNMSISFNKAIGLTS